MGNCLDTLARAPLWSVGLDYNHGTGHGVGSFLNVHEGPHGIGRRLYPEPLQANMIVTDGEPLLYTIIIHDSGKTLVRFLISDLANSVKITNYLIKLANLDYMHAR